MGNGPNAVVMVARARLAVATAAVCGARLEVLRRQVEAREPDAGNHAALLASHVDEFVAFGKAWRALAATEPPRPVAEIAARSLVDELAPDPDMVPGLQALMSDWIGDVITSVNHHVLLPDRRFAGLYELLAALHEADQADDGGASVATLRSLDAVNAALQRAVDQGIGQAEMQCSLDVWANATGGPHIRVNAAAETH